MNPQEFLNAFLEEFLVARFADPDSGEAEPFMLSFAFKDRERAARLVGWVTERLRIPDGRDSLEVEVFELPQDGFKARAAWIGDGQMYEISCSSNSLPLGDREHPLQILVNPVQNSSCILILGH